MAAEDVLKMIEEEEVKMVDLRFTDTIGKEQHLSLPASAIDSDFFEDGKTFDGSSIAGWKGIDESDMVLMPDSETAVMDLFADENQLLLRCDVLEPSTMEGYDRCPRSVARRHSRIAEANKIAIGWSGDWPWLSKSSSSEPPDQNSASN